MALFRLNTAGRWRMWTQKCDLCVNFLSDTKLSEPVPSFNVLCKSSFFLQYVVL